MSEGIPVHWVKYANPDDIEVDENGIIVNHDELDRIHVVRGMDDEALEYVRPTQIIRKVDPIWCEEFADIEQGGEYVINKDDGEGTGDDPDKHELIVD